MVRVELDRMAAENVLAFLESQGFDASISADDAGGELPSLDESRGVEVLVPNAQAAAAMEAIKAAEEASSEKGD